ncbi:MAG: UDP binding domain-containing protein, partial [Pseudomonadota bacterium]
GFVGISFKPGTDDLRESPLAELASRLISTGVEVDIYDPYVYEAYSTDNSTAGRGNAVIPDLRDRLVGDLDTLIDGSDAVLVGNFYKETAGALEKAADRVPVLDLARMNRSIVSNGTYQGICW